MKVAVLAVQGAFIEHEKMLEKLGVECIELRKKEDLDKEFDGIILPGGESTVQGKLIKELGMEDEIKNKIKLMIKQHFAQLLFGPVNIKAKIIFWKNIIFRKPKDVEKSDKKVKENKNNYNYFE